MAKHLHLYMNNPTAGSTDGTEISSGDESLPLSLTLDANQSEAKAVKVAVRCDTGYLIEGDTEIYFEGTNASKWQVAPDSGYTDAAAALTYGLWNSSLTLSNVGATNTVFWVKATSTNGEAPQNDRTVDLIADGLVIAAG